MRHHLAALVDISSLFLDALAYTLLPFYPPIGEQR